MMRVSGIGAFGAAVVTLAMVLAACGSGDSGGSSNTGGGHSGGSGGSGGSAQGGSGGSAQGGSAQGGSAGSAQGGSAGSAQGGSGGSAGAATSGLKFDHMVIILMENHGYDEIYGKATWMTSFADQNASLQKYSAIDHPSEPNYIAMFGGSQFTVNADGECCFQLDHPNLVDLLENAGLSWKGFAEDANNSGQCTFDPPRGGDHFPFLDFVDMQVASRCANMLTTSSSDDAEFLAELDAANPANFIWFTPTDDHNMHDNSVSSGDQYLQGLVTKILATSTFQNKRAALFITYDEGNGTSPSDWVYAVWSGPVVKTGFTSTTTYSHYSLLATIEANWSLPALPAPANDSSAPPMMEVFK